MIRTDLTLLSRPAALSVAERPSLSIEAESLLSCSLARLTVLTSTIIINITHIIPVLVVGIIGVVRCWP